MTQTVALQRGTTTVSGNSTSSATLFTQSGGTATRVILNQLAFTTSDAANGSGLILGVYHQSSGGQASLIGFYRNNQTLSTRAFQFLVGPNTNNSFLAGSLPTIAALYPITPIVQHTQSGDISGTGPGNISFNFSDQSTIRFSNMASNFYIGPSDSIFIKAQALDGSGNPVTITASYSFTTVTES